jgi:serine/threonine protein kinase
MLSFPNAAESLLGLTLERDWQVVEQLPMRPGATGGHFSVGYRVEHPDGRMGFCKALDYAKALRQPDVPEALRRATEEYIFERDLHRKCEGFRLSRIVNVLDDGNIRVPGCPIEQVDYIIFELADFDVRRQLDEEIDLASALRLRVLHHMAVALSQLHKHDIAHQDVKPSNVLVFPKQAAESVNKLADLGRATDAKCPVWHDALAIAGDRNYAPLEQLYRVTSVEFGARRLACDLYQLGSLAVFLFTGLSMNSIISDELHPTHQWRHWMGAYGEVLPYVEDAFGAAIDRIHDNLPKEFADDLVFMIQCLCDPDPIRRGHPANKRGAQRPYSLERMITQFDRLVRCAARAN